MARIRSSAIIFNSSKNKILLMHRKKAGKEYWVFPGGGIEEGESEEENVHREVKEEVGLEITKILNKFYFDNPYDGVNHPAFVVEVEPDEPKLIGPELAHNSDLDWYNPEWLDLKDAVKIENLHPDPVRDWLRKNYEN